MKNILRYRVFKSSDEFAKWQEDKLVAVHTVQPIHGGMDMVTSLNNDGEQESSAVAQYWVFVVYTRTEE